MLSQGAEAVIELIDDKVHKKRLKKTYRHPDLDNKIRSSRTKREIKVINKLKELGISVPELFESQDKFDIVMEFIDGKRLRDVLIEDPSQKSLLKEIGSWLAIMHDEGIIHGDLTTSNIMCDGKLFLIDAENSKTSGISQKKGKLFLIDFGLSICSHKEEDMAVDIHLLKQAFESTHYQHAEEFYEEFLKGYSTKKDFEKIMSRLEVVESRGRHVTKRKNFK